MVSNMRILFVCSTEFQLLNALNIKYYMFPDCVADIVLQRPNFKEFVGRLKSVNMFEHICYAKPELLGIHQYFRDITNKGESEVTLCRALVNTFIGIQKKIQGLIGGPKKNLDNLLYGYETIRNIKYDIVFMQGGNTVVRNFYRDMCDVAEMAILDEGIGSYYIDTICHKKTKADSAYLYDPEVALYAEKKEVKLIKIPALSKVDESFVNIANEVFDYKSNHVCIKNKNIFFDGGGELMPAYLRNAGCVKKFLFSNSIKKHLESYYQYMKQVDLFRKITADKDVYIKYHPRTPKEMLKEYDKRFFHEIEKRNIPWELYACNNNIENCNFITMVSSAVCLYPLVVGGNNRCILLYKYSDFPLPEDCKRFLKLLAGKYNKSCFIIDNERELLDVM